VSLLRQKKITPGFTLSIQISLCATFIRDNRLFQKYTALAVSWLDYFRILNSIQVNNEG
jgi:hypothetical protein